MTKVLTVRQPWAELIAQKRKHFETRSWTTAYRGPLLIHAAKGPPNHDERLFIGELSFDDPRRKPLDYGAIIARCFLATVWPTATLGLIAEGERDLGDYTPGRFAWVLINVERLSEPIPWQGRLGLWNGPDV